MSIALALLAAPLVQRTSRVKSANVRGLWPDVDTANSEEFPQALRFTQENRRIDRGTFSSEIWKLSDGLNSGVQDGLLDRNCLKLELLSSRGLAAVATGNPFATRRKAVMVLVWPFRFSDLDGHGFRR